MPEFMNLSTGQIRAKKAKKEKSPQEEAVAEMKKMSKKTLDYIRYDDMFYLCVFLQSTFLRRSRICSQSKVETTGE